MIKKIHYCWFGGKKLPKDVKKCIATWKKMLPDYEIIEWNEEKFDVNSVPFVKQAYDNKKWAFVSDYVRTYALYEQGGLYLDTDVKILKNVEDIIDKNLVFGYEDSGYFGTAVIATNIKNNPYITGMDTWVISSHFGTVRNNNGYNICYWFCCIFNCGTKGIRKSNYRNI